MAAFIGAYFELTLLAAVCDSDPLKTLEDLWSTIEKGLIIPLGESYKLLKSGMNNGTKQFFFKFQHDRVHEAAYTLTAEHDRPATHLQIGRILRKTFDGRKLESQVVEIVRHYNVATDLIDDPSERLEACRLNLMAAIKARNSVAYEACIQYFVLAKKYLPKDCWTDHYSLARKINMGLSEAASLIGHNSLTEAINTELLLNVTDVLDRAEVDALRLDQTFKGGRINESIAIGPSVLRSLGLNFPSKPSKLTFLRYLIRSKRLIKKTKLEDVINNKQLEDRRIKLMLTLLLMTNRMFFAIGDRTSSGISVLENLRLSLTYGNCGESGFGFMAAASIYINIVGDLATGERLGKVALAIDAKFTSVNLKPQIYHIYANFVAPFSLNIEEIAKIYPITIEAGLTSGDRFYTSMATALMQTVDPRQDLVEADEKSDKFDLHLCKSCNDVKSYEVALFLSRYRKATRKPIL